ncbi:hypothetical protein [Nesterenkonia suensis]
MSDYYGETQSLLRSRLELWPREGKTDDLVQHFKDRGVIEKAVEMGLCVHGALLTPRSPESPVVVEALWRREDDYLRWQEYSRADGMGRMADLLDPNREPARHLSEISHISRFAATAVVES